MTSIADRRLLLQIAYAAIGAHVGGETSAASGLKIPEAPTLLTRAGAAFVTIHRGGELRGCIGHIEADRPLGDVIRECAVAACSVDPRFPPVAASELPDLDIELSLLGALERIIGPGDIEIGRHGLLIESGAHRGLLLPQVAVEWKWDAGEFLAQTCRKAGLATDAWTHGAIVWRFEAEVFSEPPHQRSS